MEIRKAFWARHQATVERERERLEKEESAPPPLEKVGFTVPKPHSGDLLTYRAPDELLEGEILDSTAQPNQRRLPRKKLRALVSLYHQSATFLTPETLDAHIEREFALDPVHPRHLDFDMLKSNVDQKVNAPEMSLQGVASMSGFTRAESKEQRERASRVAAALWGVDAQGNPDVEAVEESLRYRKKFETEGGERSDQ